ncbi:MAG TPA: hypothetical protein VK543_09955 [Puia sp.]|nr:hypothetical protein [Puia sp.]
MTNVKQLAETATNAVYSLRRSKLKKGIPFMINAKDLPIGQCYLEYPDGKILLVELDKTGNDFYVVRELSEQEQSSLRNKFHLL